MPPPNTNASELSSNLNIANEMLKDIEKKLGITSDAFKTMSNIQVKLINDLKKENKELGKKEEIQSRITKAQMAFSAALSKGPLTAKQTENWHRAIYDLTKKKLALDKQANMQSQIEQISKELGLEKIFGYYKKIRNLTKEDASLMVIAASVAILKNVWNVFKEIDKAAADFRKEMGTTRDYMADVDTMARKAAFELRQVGVTAEIAYKSISAMAKVLGSSAYVTQGMTENVSLMQAQFGIAQDISADFLKNMAMAAGTIADSQTNMTLFTAKLSMAADTNLGEVMKDVSTATKASYSYISRSPMALIKASIEAQRLGTTLSKSADTAKSLLNFTENVKAEMEASVLVGKSIDLTKARELAYSKDIRGLNREILKIAKDVKFNQLDQFQQEAVAKALGKSSSEMAAMLQAEEQMANLEKSTDPAIRAKLKAYKEMMSATKARAEFEAKDLDTIIRIKNNAEATKTVSDAWKAITQRLAEDILPVIAKTLEFVSWVLSNVNGKLLAGVGIVTTLAAGVVAVGTAFLAFRKLTGIEAGQGIIDKLFGKPAAQIATVTKKTKTIYAQLSSLGRGIKKLLSDVGPAAKDFIIAVSEGIKTGFIAVFEGLSTGLKMMASKDVFIGIGALALLGIALIPFMFAVSKLKGLDWNSLGVAAAALIGFTAAVFGLGALMMTGVGAVLFGAGLLAFAAMGATLFLLGKGAMAAGAGMKTVEGTLTAISNMSFANTILEIYKLTSAISLLSEALDDVPTLEIAALNALATMPAFQVNPPAPTAAPVTAGVTGFNGDILNELKLLRKDLANGTIQTNVNLNGQKVSEALGRGLIFTGERAPS